jgi:Putative auto-transporter adhesin, head GIN domain
MRWLALILLFLTAASAPVQKTYLVSGFERVRVDGPYQVDIVRGPFAARAEGDQKALDQLDVHVDGNTLVIGAGTRGWELRAGESIAAPHVMLSTPLLSAVTVNGGGTVRVTDMRAPRASIAINGPGAVTITGFDADDLNAAMIGAGTLTLSGAARHARVRSNGAGSFDGTRFTANDAVLISESSGSMRLGVRYTAQVMALGIGTVHLDGVPECTISGSGPVECAGRVIRR